MNSLTRTSHTDVEKPLKVYTLAEANKALPLFKAVLKDIRELTGDSVILANRKKRLEAENHPDPWRENALNEDVETALDDERRLESELEQLSLRLSNPSSGHGKVRGLHQDEPIWLYFSWLDKKIKNWSWLRDTSTSKITKATPIK